MSTECVRIIIIDWNCTKEFWNYHIINLLSLIIRMKKIVHKYTKTENLVQIMSKIEKKIASQAKKVKKVWSYPKILKIPLIDVLLFSLSKICLDFSLVTKTRFATANLGAHVYFQPTIYRSLNLVDLLPLSMPFCAEGAKRHEIGKSWENFWYKPGPKFWKIFLP